MHEQKYTLYESLLREWNNKMNLVAPSTLPDIRKRHIMDSAQLAAHIPRDKTVIDLGSGAGFPAVVLAIFGYKVITIESIIKKCRFLEAVKSALSLTNFAIINDRVEAAIKTLAPNTKTHIFTARAFAPLIRILDWTAFTKTPYILLKGENVKSEIATAQTKYKFDYELVPSSAGPGFILSIENVRPIRTHIHQF